MTAAAMIDTRLEGLAQLVALYNLARTKPFEPIPADLALRTGALTHAERRGTDYALTTLQTWCAQLEAAAPRLSLDDADALVITPRQAYLERIRFARDLARAQQLALHR